LSLFSQSNRCGTIAYQQQLAKQDPSLLQIREQIQAFTQAQLAEERIQSGVVYSIPIVVHVLWQDSTQWVSPARIRDQIEGLNRDFRRQNADTSQIPLPFRAVAADVEFEFCFASQTPDGFPSDGIEYVPTSVSSFDFSNDAIKFSSMGGSDAWPRAEYLNIWVGNLTAGGPVGYAQQPGGGPATDGVVIDVAYFGGPNEQPSPDIEGRVLTHEVGHWFDLDHVWGDGPCSVDDGVGDTPLQSGPFYGCQTFPLLDCNSGPNGAMFMNFMQYADDSCMNLFTQGQKDRMRALVPVGGFRHSLLNSPGCDVSELCPAPFGLQATITLSDQALLVWQSSDFDQSYELRYRELGGTSWTLDTVVDSQLLLTGLTACSVYEWEVRSFCVGNSESAESLNQYFTTEGCAQSCTGPLNLMVDALDQSALLSWTSDPAVLEYQLQYQAVGSSSWVDTSLSNNSILLESLLFCQAYVYRIQSLCTEGYSGFSPLDTFSTTCDAYCSSMGLSAAQEWIEEISVGVFAPFVNTSGSNGGFGYFARDTISLARGSAHLFSLTPGYQDTATEVSWAVWVDWNQDGSFLTSGSEKLFSVLNKSGAHLKNVFLPSTTPPGPVRMRIQMRQGGPSLPCDDFSRGEVEDYTLFITFPLAQEAITGKGSLQVFPNPGTGRYTLQADGLEAGWREVVVYDLQGKSVLHQRFYQGNPSWEQGIDLNFCPAGVFLLEVRSPAGHWREKLLKQ
jgi:hypothetical protein